MKTAIWYSCLVLASLTLVAIAQTPSSQNSSDAKASGLKITGFNFEPKSTSRLEVVPVQPAGSGMTPTATANMGAEYSSAPTRNSQYYQYEKRTEVTRYATLRVKNEGTKAIKSVVWEYTDPHFKGDKELVYSAATTKLKIAPGQAAALATRVSDYRDCGMPMRFEGGVVSVARVCGRQTRKTTSYYRLEAKVKQVNYEDGSVWKAN